jgi:hypothetical protein
MKFRTRNVSYLKRCAQISQMYGRHAPQTTDGCAMRRSHYVASERTMKEV